MAPNRNGSGYDDDIDDIMASIMSGNSSLETQPPPQKRPKRHHMSPKRPSARDESFVSPLSMKEDTPQSQQIEKPVRKHNTKKIGLYVATPVTLLVLVFGGMALWNGPIAALLKPPSPFNEEVLGKMTETPLYYPTKLPGTYKIELNSITQPESSVVVYAITDDSGKKINVSLQAQPKNMTLEPLYKALTNLRNTDTKFGVIKTGTSEDGIDITNILAGKTWIIITSAKGVLSSDEIQTIVNSLEV